MKKIRWGILSTARIAHQFAGDFAYVDNGSLAAVASRCCHIPPIAGNTTPSSAAAWYRKWAFIR